MTETRPFITDCDRLALEAYWATWLELRRTPYLRRKTRRRLEAQLSELSTLLSGVPPPTDAPAEGVQL